MKCLSLITSLLFVLATTAANAMISDQTKNVSKKLGAADLIEISFNAGSSDLTEAQKKDLTQFVSSTQQKGKIEKLSILAWSDKEYPLPKEKKYGKPDVSLASQRGDKIKSYLQGTQNARVETYNMAERPNKFEEWLKLADAKVKDSMEAGGAAPRTSDETGLFGEKGQASKALVMVFLRK